MLSACRASIPAPAASSAGRRHGHGQASLGDLAGAEHADDGPGGRLQRAAEQLLGGTIRPEQLNRAVTGAHARQHAAMLTGVLAGRGPRPAAAPASPRAAPPSRPWCCEAHSWALRGLDSSSKLPCAP